MGLGDILSACYLIAHTAEVKVKSYKDSCEFQSLLAFYLPYFPYSGKVMLRPLTLDQFQN